MGFLNRIVLGAIKQHKLVLNLSMAQQFKSSNNTSQYPSSAIGFTAILNGSQTHFTSSQDVLECALDHFDDIQQLVLDIGNTKLIIWGRDHLEECYYSLPDGGILVLIGSPVGNYSWQEISNKILNSSASTPFELPWEGRVTLIKFDPIGDTWTLWNDWIGSIPVFHTQLPSGRIASSLEPVVVNTAGFSGDDVFLPSLLALLMWGHYFSDWTLFKNLKVVPPDCLAIWENADFHYTQNFSVKPSDNRLEAGWDDLIDEMYALSKQAISSVLETQPQWILPLSSGLDSRLIAGVAADLGTVVQTYTWGPSNTSDAIHAKSIARVLNMPWKNIDPGNSYFTSYQQLWANLFGSAMHFHGMYQMPFLDSLRNEPPGPILSGFIGECLTGYDVKFLVDIHASQHPYQISPNDYLHWTIQELHQLMTIPIQNSLDELADEVYNLIDAAPGALHHRLRLSILWGRQRYFTYFQSMLSDYWRGVSTPYLNREYARFSFSLPRAVLDERVLQQAMLRRYYPKLAAIPGTYASEPALLTGSYLLKKRIAKFMPDFVSAAIFPGLKKVRSNSDIECVKNNNKESFSPLFDRLDHIKEWMNIDLIEENYLKIIPNNDIHAVRKMQSIQTFAYRLKTESETRTNEY